MDDKQMNDKQKEVIRCVWARSNERQQHYHDHEWGRPEYRDEKLFEMLMLEAMQAGLSWDLILKRRESFSKAFDQWDYKKIAGYDEKKVEELLKDEGIIRNRLKVGAAITNARAFMEVQKEYGSFSDFLWGFVDHKPIINSWKRMEEVPASTPLSDRISKELKKKGFKFVGSTIVYAYMQAVGLVNDHTEECFLYGEKE